MRFTIDEHRASPDVSLNERRLQAYNMLCAEPPGNGFALRQKPSRIRLDTSCVHWLCRAERAPQVSLNMNGRPGRHNKS